MNFKVGQKVRFNKKALNSIIISKKIIPNGIAIITKFTGKDGLDHRVVELDRPLRTTKDSTTFSTYWLEVCKPRQSKLGKILYK